MKKLFYLILGSLFFISCVQQTRRLEPKRTVIAGLVTGFSEEASVILVNYCDPLSEERGFSQNLVETKGYFHTEHEYVFPQNITIRYVNKFINLFVSPGDSVFINIDGIKFVQNPVSAVKFYGSNAEINNEMFLWTDYSYARYNSHFDDNDLPKEFIESIRQDFGTAQDSINVYSERVGMSNFMKNWAYIDHKYITANQIQNYNVEASKWDVFTDPIFDVFNEENFQTMYFQYHLMTCMNTLIDDEELKRLYAEKNYVPAIKLTIKKLFDKTPQGLVRDVMLYKQLEKVLADAPEIYTVIPEINTAFSHELFNEKLKQLVLENNKKKEAKQLSESEVQLNDIMYLTNDGIESLSEIRLLNFLHKRYNDKVLYIDVWATWCGPCFEEMEHSSELHKYFEEKDVIFINLCLDSSIENWQPTINRYEIKGENYFLGRNASGLFVSDNNISGFPSYLIIDKERVLYNPAPRPSDKESVIQIIDSCLK